jgi:mono/diheme cytochrome c family protein
MTAAHRALIAATVAAVVLVTACSTDPAPDTDPRPETSGSVDSGALLGGTAPPVPPLDTPAIQRGEIVYQQHCASCHGAELQGVPDWKTPNADGTWKPPPHDSTGHTWHHSDQLIIDIIRNGGGLPETKMPAFASVLSDSDIADILEYLKANWGEQERGFQWQVTWQETNR